MDTKKILIGVGIVATLGVAYYIWKKNRPASKVQDLVKKVEGLSSADIIEANKKVEEVAKKVLTDAEMAAIEQQAIEICKNGACKVHNNPQAFGGCMSGCVPDTKNKLIAEALKTK